MDSISQSLNGRSVDVATAFTVRGLVMEVQLTEPRRTQRKRRKAKATPLALERRAKAELVIARAQAKRLTQLALEVKNAQYELSLNIKNIMHILGRYNE